MEAVTVIALESGAGFPVWAMDLRRHAPEVVVEAALPGESLESFADRVTRRIGHLASRGKRVRKATYVAAATGEIVETHAPIRRRMCETLLGAMEPGPDAEFVLGASSERLAAEPSLRQRLVELCGELAGRYLGRTVSVRFEERAQESGVFPVKSAPRSASGALAAASSRAPEGSRGSTASLRDRSAPDPLWAEGR